MVQTIGSAGESVASGVVFTLPALLFLSGGERYFQYLQIMVLAAAGGALGVLMMVPLRRSLIVKEHANLPYPEGRPRAPTSSSSARMAAASPGASSPGSTSRWPTRS